MRETRARERERGGRERETRTGERRGLERDMDRRGAGGGPVAMARWEEEGDGGRRGRDEGMANSRPRRDARLKCIMSETLGVTRGSDGRGGSVRGAAWGLGDARRTVERETEAWRWELGSLELETNWVGGEGSSDPFWEGGGGASDAA